MDANTEVLIAKSKDYEFFHLSDLKSLHLFFEIIHLIFQR